MIVSEQTVLVQLPQDRQRRMGLALREGANMGVLEAGRT